MAHRVTIRDVAERVGCGIATVSRVLNGSGPASAGTRARVLEAAEELGFRFNEIGRSLQRRRSRSLGVVVPSLLNPVFATAIQGVQDAASAEGYQLLLACVDYDEDSEAEAVATLLDKQIDGAILTVANPDDSAALDLLKRRGVPYCLIFNQPAGAEPSVGVDNAAAAAAAGAALLAAGHRETAFVGLRFRGSERARLRHEGFRGAMAAAGCPPPALLEVDHEGRGIERGLAALLAERPGITALFASNDHLALGCIRALRRLARATPGDISVIGFDGVAVAELVEPSLATVATPSAEMGAEAARAVMAAIATAGPVLPRRRILDFEFRPGGSLGPRRAGKPADALPRARRPASQT